MQIKNYRGSYAERLGCSFVSSFNIFSFSFVLMLSLLFFACSNEDTAQKQANKDEKQRKSENIFFCWDLFNISLQETNPIQKEDSMPKNAIPWAGTVSHHLLTDKQIDEWFKELVEHRPNGIDLFFFLSPSHWNLSLETWSMTNGSWKCKDGFVDSREEECEKLKNRLGVEYEPFVFKYEHGVSTLMPFIKKYFPKAEVVVIAYNGEPPVNMNTTRKFEQAFQKSFSIKDAKNKKNAFLLVSTDFSHHSNLEKTNQKDAKSRAFLSTLDQRLWTLGICDNRPAMFLLSELATDKTQCTIQYHTNALHLTKETDPEDITSYFFTFLWEDE